ncbi:Cu2+-exporting ATPase [Bradyrhizobium erythrophlei]|uniref:P-type Zn(2+) transporter n=2 Tax=Bradyrhizobium erythrophlei TaxID=1437360 RepID=A0A1M7UEL5_9BRAD|nr:Cu2+-exporting ATPase [Bradyrhizobium erythrophlei]
MECSIRHLMRGRARLTVPALRDRRLGGKFLGWLGGQSGVRTARINYDCASLVIEYDPVHEPLLMAQLERFKSLSLAEIKALCATQAPPEASSKPTTPVISKDAPLALPTLSLLMAFSANPVVMAINTPLMLWNAIPIARRAWKVWSNESRLNIDVLDTLAISASMLQGNPLAGCIVTWLIKLGDWIRDLTAAGQKRAISELLEFQTRTAWLLCDGQVVQIPATELKVDDLVVVYPGEMIPVDGEIIDGQATIDQKTITGEGLPVSRSKGEAAFAATVIREGQITIRSLRVGTATTAGQIVRLVESAPIGDTRMQNHAERFADGLVAPTLALAAGTAAVTGDFNRFLSLVIVDFGTGIRVAAPTSVLASMTHAARSGMIIKSGGHMEKLADIDTVVFDKTGTLTHGTPAVIDVLSYQNHITPNHLLGLAAAAETKLQHPVAEALRSRARELGVNVPPCHETQYRLGLGVEGQVNGYDVHVGNERFMRQCNISTDKSVIDRAGLDEKGFSSLYIAVDGDLAGLVPYSDKIRDESRQVIRKLHEMGIKNTIMLTGDNAVVARAVCNDIGLTRHFADMLPADKASVIQDLQRQGRRVAMVGDGINDSPALSFADVGIAMKHGAEVTHESADVVLMEDSLWKLVQAVEISRGAVSLIRQNYAIVATLNAIALGLALPGGLITPEVTALISNGSAILASANGVRPMLRYQ